MNMLNIKYLIYTLFLISSSVYADSNYDKYCLTPEDPSVAMICKISKNLNVPVEKTGAAMMFASVDMIGTYCNFSFNKKYLDAKMKIEKDQDIVKATRFLISSYRGKPPPGFNGDRKVFCKMEYEMFGPHSNEKFFY